MLGPREELWWRVWVPWFTLGFVYFVLVYIPLIVAASLKGLQGQSLEAVGSCKCWLMFKGKESVQLLGCFRNYLKLFQDGFQNGGALFCTSFLFKSWNWTENMYSKCLPERMQSRIGCICLTFSHCVFSNVSSNCQPERMHSHIGCICLFFSIVPFQMYPQGACLWGCIVTLVAFVWLNVIVGLFLQDFLNLQTKVIMFKSLFHYVVFCPNGSFKLIQINYLLLVNNHKY